MNNNFTLTGEDLIELKEAYTIFSKEEKNKEYYIKEIEETFERIKKGIELDFLDLLTIVNILCTEKVLSKDMKLLRKINREIIRRSRYKGQEKALDEALKKREEEYNELSK